MSAHTKPADSDHIDASAVSNLDDTGHLRELHVERGWPATDIAREVGAEPADVRDRLKELGVFQGQTHPPKSGLARKVWEAGMENGGDLP